MLSDLDKGKFTYALDIGTRTVIGIISVPAVRGIRVIDTEIMPHPERSMFDGQVDDIAQVIEVIREVTRRLEERNGVTLHKVSIAAAGRSLRTEKVTISKPLDPSDAIDEELIDVMEMEGIHLAQEQLKSKMIGMRSLYYCVGNSVTGITLDGMPVSNPIGHSGNRLDYSLVATFLPHNVSDTLYKVVEGSGLEIDKMTLEPIAALEVAVIPSVRLLNMAIIDIGAGTSDIAITKDGEIFAYGMVDIAGDEVTEALMKTYLLDFEEAERVKISLMTEPSIVYTDILGVEHELSAAKIIKGIDGKLDFIAGKIAKEVLEANQKSPDGAFLVGGASQLPTFRERIAAYLDIDSEKVQLRQVQNLRNVDLADNKITGPDYITPVGIAYMSHFMRRHGFLSVRINGRIYRLFNRENLKLSDALVLAGFNAARLIQTRGKSLTFTIDGEMRKIQGKAGEPSGILLNAKLASINSTIKHLDIIEITKPVRGEDAEMRLGDVVDFKSYFIENRTKIPVIERVFVNGEEKFEDYMISDGDEILTVRNTPKDGGLEPFIAEMASAAEKWSSAEEDIIGEDEIFAEGALSGEEAFTEEQHFKGETFPEEMTVSTEEKIPAAEAFQEEEMTAAEKELIEEERRY